MPTSSLKATREALSQLLALTDEEGSPAGPTAKGDLNGELDAFPAPSSRAAVEDLFDRIRAAIGLEEIPEGSASFFESLKEGEEECHLHYKLSPPESSRREERITAQVDPGKILALTRRLPGEGNGEGKGPGAQERLSAKVTRSRSLESGATVKTKTSWEAGDLGPVELGAIEAFFIPAVKLLERKNKTG